MRQAGTNSRDGWENASAANRQANPDGQGYHDASEEEPERKSGWLRKVGRGTAKAAYWGSAADVIVKDARRVRPMYPEVWRQLFSKQGLRRLRDKTFNSDVQYENGFPWSSTIASVTAIGAFSVVLMLAINGFFPTNMALINKVAVMLALVLSLVSGISYGAITAMLIKRRRILPTSKDERDDGQAATGAQGSRHKGVRQ